MKKHFKNNILIYFAILGGLGFIPLIAELKITQFTLISLLIGTVWSIGFLTFWVLNNYLCTQKYCKQKLPYKQNAWIDCEEFTGYFRLKNLNNPILKVAGLPCTPMNIHNIYICKTDVLKNNPELSKNIVYVKRNLLC